MLYNKYNHNQNIILESHANIFQIQNYKFVSACAHVREKKKTDRQTDRQKEIETDSHPTAKQCLDAAGSGEKS